MVRNGQLSLMADEHYHGSRSALTTVENVQLIVHYLGVSQAMRKPHVMVGLLL